MKKIHKDITIDLNNAEFMNNNFMGRTSHIINGFISCLYDEFSLNPNSDYLIVQLKISV